jgi:hypothetical protein
MEDRFRVLLSIAEAQAQSSPFRGGDSPNPFAPQDGNNARPFQDIKSMDELPRDARVRVFNVGEKEVIDSRVPSTPPTTRDTCDRSRTRSRTRWRSPSPEFNKRPRKRSRSPPSLERKYPHDEWQGSQSRRQSHSPYLYSWRPEQ